jgi:small subunit ribosomal protein S6
MQRAYELMFIVRPDITDEDLDKLVSTLETQIAGAGGVVKNVERMGRRRLAYVVRKFRDGIYVLFTLEGAGEVMKEVERRLRVAEPVIKFITVRSDLETKRLDKVKALRAAKVRRPAPAPVTAPPAEPAAEAGAEPAPVSA